jgi:hypothetical protein
MMKSDIQPVQAEEQALETTLVLQYWSDRPRSTIDVSQKYSLADGIEAHCREHGYVRLQDHIPGVIEVYDRGKTDGMHDRFWVIVRVHNPGQPKYIFVLAVESFDTLMVLMRDTLLSCIPLVPEVLKRIHGVRL